MVRLEYMHFIAMRAFHHDLPVDPHDHDRTVCIRTACHLPSEAPLQACRGLCATEDIDGVKPALVAEGDSCRVDAPCLVQA